MKPITELPPSARADHILSETHVCGVGAGHPLKRIGGELPLFADRIGPPQPWQPNWLAFSNGRAALAWLFDRHGTKSAAICAYTCPTLPRFLRRRGMEVVFFDVGADTEAHLNISANCFILPALFGSSPWFNYGHNYSLTIIDAAQTAFGHVEFAVPSSGAVLSCPRKCTELADGAVLAISEYTNMSGPTANQLEVAALPVAHAAAWKTIARGYWEAGVEDKAVCCNTLTENLWPETPHRMSDPSRAMLERMDREWHEEKRHANCLLLSTCLAEIPIWQAVEDATAPFSLPIFVGNRDELLASLKAQRIFATALWPDAEHDPDKHPNAAWMAKHLVSLPVDQRHDADDMRRVAEVVLAVAKPPPDPLKSMLQFVA